VLVLEGGKIDHEHEREHEHENEEERAESRTFAREVSC